MRDQKGITLVALVITIIVLLILAGVSISLVVGNNGVLTQASQAVVTNNKETAKQDIDMAVAGVYTLYMGEWANNTNLKFIEGRDAYLTIQRLNNNKTDQDATFAGTAPNAITYTKGNLTVTFKVDAHGKVYDDTYAGE